MNEPSQGTPTDTLLALLRCPGCRGALRAAGDVLQCLSCGTPYQVVNGVPVLINDAQSVFRAADIAAELRAVAQAGARPSLSDAVRHLTPEIDHNYRKPSVLSRFASLCKSRNPGRTRVLALCGMEDTSECALPLWEDVDLVYAAVLPRVGPAISCDAQRLPFADGSFDAVAALGVLHQTLDPGACAAEIHRVLANRGLVYVETPFMQPVHQSAHDFQRFTPLGLRHVLRNFEEVESGVGAGPGAALAWAWRSFLGSLGRSRLVRFALRTGGNFTGFFLQYFDRFVGRPASHDAPFCCTSSGHRSQATLSDQRSSPDIEALHGPRSDRCRATGT